MLWRLEVEANYKNSIYDELRDQQKFLDKKIAQTSLNPKLTAGLLIFPHWLYLEADVENTGLLLTETEGRSYKLFRQSSRIGISLPARPLNLTLVAEQFYHKMSASPEDFGYQSTSGMQYYPLIDFSLANGSRLFLKYPVLQNVSGRKELVAGLHLRLGGVAAPYPTNQYQPAWVLKIEYSDETIKFNQVREVLLRFRTWTVGLAYNF